MKDFEFTVKVPPPLVEWTFHVEQYKDRVILDVSKDGFRSERLAQRISVPVDAFDAFCREWVKEHGN